MATLLRVPFGLRASDNLWVGPEDVSQTGLACDCICPSCGLPLKKNTCTDRIDHFSHHTRKQQGKVARDCEYSFWVACATMGRQILEHGGNIQTPKYSKTLHMPGGAWYQYHDDLRKTVEIAPSGTIAFTPSEVSVEQVISQRRTDAVITVHGVQIIVFFLHPERKTVSLDDIPLENTGILTIDLSSLMTTYKSLKGADSFKERIRIFLFEDSTNKQWLWHHREARAMTNAEAELLRAAEARKEAQAKSVSQYRGKPPYYPPATAKKSFPSTQAQRPVLTGKWCNIICTCGNRFREFVRNNDLNDATCRSCGLFGKDNLKIEG